MQDGTTKRTTVEDQELADMIANLNNKGVSSQTANPVSSSAQMSQPNPTTASNTTGSLPPLPSTPPPSPQASTSTIPPSAQMTNTESVNSSNNFNIPGQTSGLPPLPSTNNPTQSPTTSPQNPDNMNNTEKFEPPVSNLPPLGQKTPLPPLPNNEIDSEDDIDKITADFPDSPGYNKSNSVEMSDNKNDNLRLIKQDALDKLRPLVDELNLSPKEKFDTLLLLIRSSDDKSLISRAYEAANQIGDETAKAAALLDIVKEIDYFENK